MFFKFRSCIILIVWCKNCYLNLKIQFTTIINSVLFLTTKPYFPDFRNLLIKFYNSFIQIWELYLGTDFILLFWHLSFRILFDSRINFYLILKLLIFIYIFKVLWEIFFSNFSDAIHWILVYNQPQSCTYSYEACDRIKSYRQKQRSGWKELFLGYINFDLYLKVLF